MNETCVDCIHEEGRENWELPEDFRAELNNLLVVNCPGSMTLDELDKLADEIVCVVENHCLGGTNEA